MVNAFVEHCVEQVEDSSSAAAGILNIMLLLLIY